MAAVLEVRDLRKSFGGIGAVNGVSFAVHEGEILGLIGPNGSGKSTLFNCILGQLAPSSGEVRIDGRPISGMRPCDLNRLGIDTRRYTLMAFAIGSALGGIAGVLYAPLVQFIEPTAFTLGLSFNLLLMVIVGGAGRFFGPFLGAAVSVLLPEWLRFSEGLYLMAYAVFVMVLLAFFPSGLLGLAERLRNSWPRSSKSAT